MTVKGGFSRERQETATEGTYQNETRFGGVVYRVSKPLELTAAVYRSAYDSVAGPGTRQLDIIGATYFLSKHTNLYAEFDVNRYDGALTPTSTQTSQHGVSLGVHHMF